VNDKQEEFSRELTRMNTNQKRRLLRHLSLMERQT